MPRLSHGELASDNQPVRERGANRRDPSVRVPPQICDGLVIGASGGIGQAFVQALRGDPRCSDVQVISRGQPIAWDLTDEASLAALASQCPHDAIFVAADARMSEVYFAAYRRVDGVLEECLAPSCAAPGAVALPAAGDWFGFGSAFKDSITQRWGELRRNISGISEKMLASTLKTLEADGLVRRTAYPEVPPRVEYALTDLGRDLMGRVLPLMAWVAEHADAMLDRSR